MKAKPSAFGEALGIGNGRLGGSVVNRRQPGGTLCLRGRYLESKEKMKRFCQAMAACPTPWAPHGSVNVAIRDIWDFWHNDPVTVANLPAGTYRVQHWGGWACDNNPGEERPYYWFMPDWEGLHICKKDGEHWEHMCPYDPGFHTFATQEEMIAHFTPRHARPHVDFVASANPTPLGLYYSSPPPDNEPSGYVEFRICQHTAPGGE